MTYEEVHQDIHRILTVEQRKRIERKSKDWISAERSALINAINSWRERLDTGAPISENTFSKLCEAPARGHVDYSARVCRYATDLAFLARNL